MKGVTSCDTLTTVDFLFALLSLSDCFSCFASSAVRKAAAVSKKKILSLGHCTLPAQQQPADRQSYKLVGEDCGRFFFLSGLGGDHSLHWTV